MSSSLRARLILASLHFVKTTLEVGFSENVEIVVGLVFTSLHFVKSTFGADDTEATFVGDATSSSSRLSNPPTTLRRWLVRQLGCPAGPFRPAETPTTFS